MDSLTVSLVAIMIPGVIMAFIYDVYTQHKSWDSFKYILISIIFGLMIYFIDQCIIFIWQFMESKISNKESVSWYFLSVWDIANKSDIKVVPYEVFFGVASSIPLGLLVVYINKKRIFHEIFLKMGVSNKYGDDNVFIRSIEKMSETSSFCYVLLRDENLSVAGKIYLYNENDKTQEIGLLDATITDTETGNILFLTSFIYLSKEYGKIMIIENYLEDESHE
ncbi:hypothetical protein EFV65_20420 [Yersinia enterocolitica]|nr:hypothetical protein [Yersinia enterocolitica]